MFYDHSNAESGAKLLEAGLSVEKANKSINEGLSTVSSYIRAEKGVPQLLVMPQCSEFIKEIVSYKWDQKKEAN